MTRPSTPVARRPWLHHCVHGQAGERALEPRFSMWPAVAAPVLPTQPSICRPALRGEPARLSVYAEGQDVEC